MQALSAFRLAPAGVFADNPANAMFSVRDFRKEMKDYE